jgi:hypothetical protein
MPLFEYSNIRFARMAGRTALIRIFKFSLRAPRLPALICARIAGRRWPLPAMVCAQCASDGRPDGARPTFARAFFLAKEQRKKPKRLTAYA